MPAKRGGEVSEAEYWNRAARRLANRFGGRPALDELLGEQRRNAHLGLISRWADITSCQRILKTDLWEEALGSHHFMFHLAQVNDGLIGIDISSEVAARAKSRSQQYSSHLGEYICCDVRKLPFKNSSIDLVISTSTLDHFSDKGDIRASLQEIGRVLSPGGALLLTMDNKSNFTEPLFRLFLLLTRGRRFFFIGESCSINELKCLLEGVGFSVEDTTAIIHNPRVITKILVRLLRRLDPARSESVIRKVLAFLDNLETRKAKYLTGLFIAVKAVKPQVESKQRGP